jgi:hypothetical protein
MDGSTWGTIYQDLQTQGGTTYALSLLLAKNPVCSGTTLMKLWVAWETTAGKVIGKQLLTFNRNSSVENMRWEQVQIGINATGSVTRLVFQSGTPGPCGPAIDDVIVV